MVDRSPKQEYISFNFGKIQSYVELNSQNQKRPNPREKKIHDTEYCQDFDDHYN